ncbi:MAG: SDR family oxidoreductase [Actinomycetales bacterium]|nr:SDR family oxidoreductase [Actinomycetales bacterium]
MAESRVAVVTGAGTGIGAACATALAPSCGRVVLLGRRFEKLEGVAADLRSAHPGLVVDTRSVDVSDVDAVSAFAEWVATELGRVDVLVNNAGSPQPKGAVTLREIAEAWESTFRANALSVVLMTEALKPILARPGGRIVTIGSFAAQLGTGSPAYASAKGAIEVYTVTLMRELGEAGITANVVAPGYTAGTELLTGRITPERHERLLAGNASRRPGTPEEIASAVAYLASPPAGFINGQVLTANGGTFLPG